MADALFFSCLLLFLAAMQGTGAVDYAVNGNTSNSNGGVRFKTEIGTQNSLQTMADASNFIWNWDRNGQTSVQLIEGIADFVRLKANYILSHWVQLGQGDRWD
ncbi:hypothetical protein Goshw_011928 [Gossypium schwendimanii]|uniref:Uncharacterized protein n=1 Tax=Gossypium schwendimanii TaxID=34291 RepID=A0A7J9MSL3_GOSSC|nr:hypothetical protein [Gossypium schwendimanii]